MELINKQDALHAVLHNQGDAAVAAVQAIKPINPHGELREMLIDEMIDRANRPMNNAELIKALRETDFGYVCEHCEHEDMCRNNDCVIIQAADALEAADEKIADCIAAIDALDDSNDAYIKENERLKKRIVNLLTALHLANEKLAYVDCQPYTELDGEEMIEDWVKTLVYEELKTQLPKEGEWIYSRGDGKTCVEGWTCSACGNSFHTHVPYFEEFHYCPNCGAKMRKGAE